MGFNGEKRERTPAEWFAEALRWYVQGHQGCACCHAQHCVFRSEYGLRTEYYCTACDFSVCHDGASDRFFATKGEPSELPSLFLAEEEPWHQVRTA